MKRIALVFAVVLAAVVSRAATVSWTSGDIASLKTADIKSIEGYYYVIDADTYTTLASKTQEELYNAYYKAGVTSDSGKIDLNDRGSANWDQTEGLNGEDLTTTDIPQYVVAVYVAQSSFGGTYTLASVATSATTTDGETGLDDPDTVLNSSIGVKNYYDNIATGGWAAVPEPTTVALLAIGLAAVGLKRKVA